MSSMLMVNQFQVVEKFLYSLKISENMAFSGDTEMERLAEMSQLLSINVHINIKVLHKNKNFT